MSDLERDIERLHRYHDGEMRGFERVRFEWRLRRSPALRAELERLEALSRLVGESAAPERTPAPDLWPGIERALAGIDAQVEAEGRAARGRRARVRAPGHRRLPRLPGWAVAAAAAAAAAALAVLLVTGAPPREPATQPQIAGGASVLRFLDSGGAPVMVIEDRRDDVTIVWMMDAV